MPVWDKTDPKDHWTTDIADTVKCPGCGQNIYFDATLRKLICRHCGGAFDPETKELSYRLERKDVGDAGEAESSNHEIICNSCGATVITDKDTSATFCAFCGSPALITGRLSQKFAPDYIIPFKITKEEAKKRFLEFAGSRRFVPSGFKTEATLSKVTGLYVPFWLMDGTCHMKVKGEGRKNRDKDGPDRYEVDVTYDFKVRGVPFDGSQAVSDRLMEAIEPFDYSGLRPFSNSYLPGYYAERYNLTALNMSERIKNRMDIYAGQYAGILCPEYDEFKVDRNDSYADDLSQKYALLPVWFLNYEYRGHRYGFAVNGQTGEVDGDMPVSVAKGFLKKLGFWAIVGTPVAALAGLVIWKIISSLTEIRLAFSQVILPYGFFFVLLLFGIVFFGGKNGGGSLYELWREGRSIDPNGTLGSFFGRPIRSLKIRYDNLGNEINMLLDEAPEVTQYYESIPGASVQKKETFIGTSDVHKSG